MLFTTAGTQTVSSLNLHRHDGWVLFLNNGSAVWLIYKLINISFYNFPHELRSTVVTLTNQICESCSKHAPPNIRHIETDWMTAASHCIVLPHGIKGPGGALRGYLFSMRNVLCDIFCCSAGSNYVPNLGIRSVPVSLGRLPLLFLLCFIVWWFACSSL